MIINIALSKERAKIVKNYPLKGIGQSRLIANGYGEDKPIANNDTDS